MQKYNKGDLVHIANDLGQSMSHFENDCEAIVMFTYDEKFGCGDTDSYCVHIKRHGQRAWYKEHQLNLIEENRLDLLEQWETEEKQEANMKADLDWIFAHGKEVLEVTHGATISALAKCFGLTNLWGSSGEGFIYYDNAMTTLAIARQFLESGDKQGYLNRCKAIKKSIM